MAETSPIIAKNISNRDKIAVKTPTRNKDDQKCAPRPSWRTTWRLKRATVYMHLFASLVIVGLMGAPKII